MALIDVSGLTLNPQEATDINKIIFEKVFMNPTMDSVHDLVTGIDMKTQIVLASRIDTVLGKISVGCTPNAEGGFTMSQKYWDPAREDFRLVHCAADLPVLLKIFKKAQRMNPDFYDAIGSEEMGVLISAVENAMAESLITKVWFGNKTAAIQPAGDFKTGTDLTKFNSIDGLFKQIFTDIPVGSAQQVAIAANAGLTYVGQELAVDEAYNTFVKMFRKQDSRLAEQVDAQLLVTRSLYDNFADSLESKTANYSLTETIQNGLKSLTFRGVKIVQMSIWDRQIKAYQDNGTKLNKPHRAVLTLKSNIPVGTMATEDFTTLDSFYDKTLKSNIIDAVYTLDAKHLESYLTVAAY
jgi:hypothetical protein